jgi:cobyrinic acid a,c-diamide synthase
MSLIIAGERSGVGKTTITLAMLAFLSRQSQKVQSFKVGPDYIDPMFHTAVTGRPCRNLDPILTSPNYVRACFARHCQDADYALIEGVMGLFDGAGRSPQGEDNANYASTAHIAQLLNLPILLVIDCSRLSGSIAAIVHGYRSFYSDLNLVGVILNRVGSDRHLELLKTALEPLKVSILGVLRRHDDIIIPDRHLGLIPTAELDRVAILFERLANLAANSFDWQQLLPLLKILPSSPSGSASPSENLPVFSSPIKIAIARDRAFNFYYQDNLDILENLGAELIFWSPLEDEKLPPGVMGLYFGGGFPEVFASGLAENQTMRAIVRQAILSGMPTYAECGGLMYLCQKIVDFEQQNWTMLDILPTKAVMSKRLSLGYRRATVLQNSSLVRAQEILWGHEFHRSELTCLPQQPLFELAQSNENCKSVEGWQTKSLHASYLHLHFGEYQIIPHNFLNNCLAFSKTNTLS